MQGTQHTNEKMNTNQLVTRCNYLTYFRDSLMFDHLSCDFCHVHADADGDGEDEVGCEFYEPCQVVSATHTPGKLGTHLDSPADPSSMCWQLASFPHPGNTAQIFRILLCNKIAMCKCKDAYPVTTQILRNLQYIFTENFKIDMLL